MLRKKGLLRGADPQAPEKALRPTGGKHLPKAIPVIVVVFAAGGAADGRHISVLLSFFFIIQDAGWVYHLFEVAQGGFRGQL